MQPRNQIPPGSAKADVGSLEHFLEDPCGYFGNSLHATMTLPASGREELQLAGLKRRFEQFRGNLPMLDRLADGQSIDKLEAIDEVAPLLFGQSVYKSYPTVFLDKHRYADLTKWLNKLTTHDLSQVDVSGCRNIDDWMLTLRRETELVVCHTSGSSGTMSFLPWDRAECTKFIASFLLTQFQQFGKPEKHESRPVNIDCVYPFFRTGGLSHAALNDFIVDVIAGSEERFHAAYPGRLSADMMLLATRYRAAAAKGQLDRLTISPEMAARREEFEVQQREMPARAAEFFTTMRTKLAGKRVFILCASHMLCKVATEGLSQGISRVFSPDSMILSGGGGKGMVLPPDWKETTSRFFGTANINVNYGMSEGSGFNRVCEHGHYHFTPWVIPFILDADTYKLQPCRGRQSGCFAFFDLSLDTRWGGFISGDFISIEWDEPCACGQISPYIVGEIKRLSEVKNTAGEEKLSCAAAPEAYADALGFLNEGTF